MLTNKTGLIVLFICIVLITQPVIHAAEVEFYYNSGGLNGPNSWFQPIVYSKEPFYYVWTVQGPVYYTESSHKWTGWYMDSGGLNPFVRAFDARVYKDPYIKGVRLGVIYAHLQPMAAKKIEIISLTLDEKSNVYQEKKGVITLNKTQNSIGTYKATLR